MDRTDRTGHPDCSDEDPGPGTAEGSAVFRSRRSFLRSVALTRAGAAVAAALPGSVLAAPSPGQDATGGPDGAQDASRVSRPGVVMIDTMLGDVAPNWQYPRDIRYPYGTSVPVLVARVGQVAADQILSRTPARVFSRVRQPRVG